MMNRWKQKCTTKSIKEKASVLNDLKKSMSNKEVAKKFGVPKSMLSTWVKNKEKILKAHEVGDTKQQKTENSRI